MLINVVGTKSIDKVKKWVSSQVSELVEKNNSKLESLYQNRLNYVSFYFDKKKIKSDSKMFSSRKEVSLIIKRAEEYNNLYKLEKSDREVGFIVSVYKITEKKGVLSTQDYITIRVWDKTTLRDVLGQWDIGDRFPNHHYEILVEFTDQAKDFYKKKIEEIIWTIKRL